MVMWCSCFNHEIGYITRRRTNRGAVNLLKVEADDGVSTSLFNVIAFVYVSYFT